MRICTKRLRPGLSLNIPAGLSWPLQAGERLRRQGQRITGSLNDWLALWKAAEFPVELSDRDADPEIKPAWPHQVDRGRYSSTFKVDQTRDHNNQRT